MSALDSFQPFDSIATKRHDVVKIVSLTLNIIFFAAIIVLSVFLVLILNDKKASPVSYEQIIPIQSSYYPDKIVGAASFQFKNDILNSNYYLMPDFYNMKSDGSFKILSHFRTYQQTSEYTCGCASMIMAIDYTGKHDSILNESYCGDLADIGSDIHNNSYGKLGAPPESIEKALNALDYETISNRKMQGLPFSDLESFEKWVEESIDNGYPIIVHSMDLGGHYTVIIGIDNMGTDNPYDDVLIIADPSDRTDHRQDGYLIYGAYRFYTIWGIEYSNYPGISMAYQFIQVKGKKK